MSKKKTKGIARKVGRPSQFSDVLHRKIIELTEQGKTVEEICEIVGVHPTTLYIWQKEKEEFRYTIRQARKLADKMVEAALFQRAIGYKHRAVKIFCDKNGDITEHEYIEHYPPSEIAGIFWLKNRQPKRWADKPLDGDGSPKQNGPNEPDEIIVEFQDETPNKDAK